MQETSFGRLARGLEEELKKQEAIGRITIKIATDEPLTKEDHDAIKRYGLKMGMRRKQMPGGLSSEQVAAREFAKILTDALKIVKKELSG
jgi:hypothetical protein